MMLLKQATSSFQGFFRATDRLRNEWDVKPAQSLEKVVIIIMQQKQAERALSS